jgi:predicted transcriptional regulator YdeE
MCRECQTHAKIRHSDAGIVTQEAHMEPKIVERGPMLLVGLGFYGDPFAESAGWTEENEIGRLWNRFMAYIADHPNAIQGVIDENVAYELHVETVETATAGFREVFVGVEVERLVDVPVELSAKILPATTYAVFTLKGEQIAADWSMIIGEWVSRSTYDAVGTYGFQRYDERFQGVENLAASELDVYVPIKSSTDVASDGDL